MCNDAQDVKDVCENIKNVNDAKCVMMQKK